MGCSDDISGSYNCAPASTLPRIHILPCIIPLSLHYLNKPGILVSLKLWWFRHCPEGEDFILCCVLRALWIEISPRNKVWILTGLISSPLMILLEPDFFLLVPSTPHLHVLFNCLLSRTHHHDCVTSGQYVLFEHSNILTLLYNRPI